MQFREVLVILFFALIGNAMIVFYRMCLRLNPRFSTARRWISPFKSQPAPDRGLGRLALGREVWPVVVGSI